MRIILKLFLVVNFSLIIKGNANAQIPIPPEITCPADTIVYLDGECITTVVFAGAIATGYPAPTVTYNNLAGGPFFEGNSRRISGVNLIGPNTVTVKATNSAGIATCTYTITFVDTTRPVFTVVPNDVTVNVTSGLCGAFVDIRTTAIDNCSDNIVTHTTVFIPVGTTIQTFTASDQSGNSTSHTRTVTVIDNEPPSIVCPEDITVFTGPDEVSCGKAVRFLPVIAIDNCGAASLQTSHSSGSVFPVGETMVTAKATDGVGNTSSCSFTITVIDNTPPTITCPTSKTIYFDNNCMATLPDYRNLVTVSDNCTPAGSIQIDQDPLPGFPAGGVGNTMIVTITARDAEGNLYSCNFNVQAIDTLPPVITCPPGINVVAVPNECHAIVSDIQLGNASAIDNCDGPRTVNRTGVPVNNIFPIGVTTITYSSIDDLGNTSTCIQTVTVRDVEPPVISNVSANTVILAPPNHKMKDVTINYTSADLCGPVVGCVLSVTSNEPVNGTSDGDTAPDWEIIDAHHVKLRAERSANGNGRIYTITITCTDAYNNSTSATTEVRVAHNITSPQSGNHFIVGSTVNFSGEFWDKPFNKHTAKWLIDDNISVKGIVTEPIANKNGKVTGSYKFTAPGVYKLQMNTIDQNNITSYANTNGDLEAIVVIYDPNGGHTYGGGYYNSSAGALKSNPSATGKASYGFAMNYFKNSTNPKGETQFEFKVGSFEFNALNFDYLVISNSMAQFKGTGKIIGGQSGIGFTMTVTDGQLDGTGVDKIRMKIYNKNNGSIIYDNQFGASDAALPTQAVGVNSTVVISGTNSSLTSANTNQKAEMDTKALEVLSDLEIIAFPNPSTNNFMINVNAKTNERITMQVVDMYGRIMETRNVNANSPIMFGDHYKPGTYFVRILQGIEHKEIKLIKLSD